MKNVPHSQFSNLEVTIPQASISLLNFTHLTKSYAISRRYICLLSTLCYSILVALTINQPWINMSETFKNVLIITALIEGVFSILTAIYRNFADPKKGYNVREQDISYKSGLIFNKVVSQPILRIQHVELKRGPVDRKLGLAKLHVFSAGGAMHTFEIPGLSLNDAEHLRQFILSHKDLGVHG